MDVRKKRSYSNMARNGHEESPKSAQPSPFMTVFEHFRQELDEHYDRREKLIKASRDVTASSKKIIFGLQRIRKLGEPLPQHVIKANKQYYDTLKLLMGTMSKEAQGVNFYRYYRQISPGCQEYMEAVLFEHYLETASLLSYNEAAAKIKVLSEVQGEDAPLSMHLTWEDYVLGLFDMTGELMRFAITAMATTGALPAISGSINNKRNVLHDMQVLRTALSNLEIGGGPIGKDFSKKLDVTKASVEKVEKALYGIVVRGAERPAGWMPDLQTVDIES